MQSKHVEKGPQKIGYCSNKNIALLTGKERDWLLGNLDLSKSYEYKLKSKIKKKIQTFVNLELPLLVKNNLIIFYESESLGAGFGGGTHYNDSSLGKAKVLGYLVSSAISSIIVYCTTHNRYLTSIYLNS
jgi:hypothetical protein